MRGRLHVLCAAVLLFGAINSQGMFRFVETTNVAIARLLANLQRRLGQGSNEFEVHYDLARVYSMPSATNVPVSVENDRPAPDIFQLPPSEQPREVYRSAGLQEQRRSQKFLANAIFHYRQAVSLSSKETNGSPNQWFVLPVHLGLAWCLDQAGRTNEAINAYRETLELAWDKEVAVKFSLKERAAWSWAQVRSGKNPLSLPPKARALSPGPSFSEETIGYLLKLLDPVRDAKEIARLKES